MVNAISRVHLYAERVGAWRVRPEIWTAGEEFELEIAWFDQSLDPATAFVDAGPGVTLSDLTVADATGYRLVATATVDADVATGARTITIGDASNSRTATDAIWVAQELPEQGECADVVDEGDVPDGAWVGSDAGLGTDGWDTSNCLHEPSGREQAIPVHLDAGERLTATVWVLGAVWPTLYLLDSCDASAEAFHCFQEAAGKPTTELVYTATEDQDLLLVVDTRNFPDGEVVEWVVDLRRESVPASLDGDYASRGSSQSTTAWSTGEVWVDGDVAFEFSADVPVADVVVAADGLSAAMTISPDTAADLGDRDLTVTTSAGSATTPDALSVGRYLYTAHCIDAESEPPIPAGWHEGSTAVAAFDAVDGADCLPVSDGYEALLPVELGPGDTMAATVFPLGDADIVLYVKGACGDGPTLACVDLGTQGGAEYIEFVAPPEGGTAWLIIDGYGIKDETDYLLYLEVRP